MASVLWAIESGVQLRESLTVTQKKTYWVIPTSVKMVPYAQVKDIDFFRKKKSRQLLLNSSPSHMDLCISASPSSRCVLLSTSTQQFSLPLHDQPQCSSSYSTTSTVTTLFFSPSQEEVDCFFATLACTSSKPTIVSLARPYCSRYIPKLTVYTHAVGM